MFWHRILNDFRRLATSLLFNREGTLASEAKHDVQIDAVAGDDDNDASLPKPYSPDNNVERNESLHTNF